jgi:hypothetical protein
MKRFVLLTVLILFLTSCDIITEIPDDDPILKDDITDILDGDDDNDNPLDEQTEEEIIMETVNHVFAKMETENAYKISQDVDVEINYAGTNYTLTSTNIQTSIEMEKEEQYYFERVLGQFEYSDPERHYESMNESRLIDGRSGTLREYSIADNYVSIVQEINNQTFLEFLATEATPYELDFDVDDFITLDRREDDDQYYLETGQRDNNYDITMALSDFGNDELTTILSELGIPDIEQEVIDLFLSVNEWYIYYRFEYTTTFTLEDIEFDLIIRTESNFHYADHIEEKISVFEEPYVLILPTTKEDIIFTSSNDVMPWHGLIANQEGWTRQYVEPGIYMMYVNTYSTDVDYTIYDEEGNIITFDQRLQITEPTTFYVKLLSPEDAQVSVVFEPLELNDIVIDHTHDLFGDTITGYHEGNGDLNLYYLQGTSTVGGYINIDVSSVDSHVYREDLHLLTTTVCPEDEPNCERYADFCTMTEEESCIAYILPNTEYSFEIIGDDIGDYTFTYTFEESMEYPSELDLMYHMDDFETNHLFYIKRNQEIYLKFDVLIFDQYYFRIDDFDPYIQRVVLEVYDENGNLLETNWQGLYELGRGSYYIKLTTNQNNTVFTLELLND